MDRDTSNTRILSIAGLVVGLSGFSVLMSSFQRASPTGYLYALGTLHAHVCLAATLAAFRGPNWTIRMVLSGGWAYMAHLAFTHRQLMGMTQSVRLGSSLAAMWFVLVVTLVVIALVLNLNVLHRSEATSLTNNRFQLRIYQILLLTSFIALLVTLAQQALSREMMSFGTYFMTSLAAFVQSLTLTLAVLQKRYTAFYSLIALGFIAVFTVLETRWIQSNGYFAAYYSSADITRLNTATSGWLLCVLAIVRANGYYIGYVRPVISLEMPNED